MKKIRTIQDLPIDSTKLCCNFVNTIYSWKGGDKYDFLQDYNTFIDWCAKLSLFDSEYIHKLRKQIKRVPGEAHSTLTELKTNRLLMHDFISAIARNDQKKINKILLAVNPMIMNALGNITLELNGSAFIISYPPKTFGLKTPGWVIVKSLYDLITEMDLTRIKECPTCGWVFFDETKNGKRKWCNPLNCGTQDKMYRYNQKLREQNN